MNPSTRSIKIAHRNNITQYLPYCHKLLFLSKKDFISSLDREWFGYYSKHKKISQIQSEFQNLINYFDSSDTYFFDYLNKLPGKKDPLFDIFKKYKLISPVYIAHIYFTGTPIGENDIEYILDKQYKDIQKIIITFQDDIETLIMMYVYEYPLKDDSKRTDQFIYQCVKKILRFMKKLIEMNVYAIFPIVERIIVPHNLSLDSLLDGEYHII